MNTPSDLPPKCRINGLLIVTSQEKTYNEIEMKNFNAINTFHYILSRLFLQYFRTFAKFVLNFHAVLNIDQCHFPYPKDPETKRFLKLSVGFATIEFWEQAHQN
jgi:hypothetical protein